MSLHEPTLLYRPNSHRLLLPSKLSIIPDFGNLGSWYVRNLGLDGGPPVYFSTVDHTDRLMETIEVAWDTERKCGGLDDWRPIMIYLESIRDAEAWRKKVL